jgi:DNA-binding transcriptional regulator PaaX
MPLVPERLLPQNAAGDSADALSVAVRFVLSQAAAVHSPDAVPVATERLLPQAARSDSVELPAFVSLRADAAERSLSVWLAAHAVVTPPFL